jgi:hypothetical protein
MAENVALLIGGKKFVSAKDAAILGKYAQDYVGQLCRSGKVIATRIGRNWYIEEESLLTYIGESGEIIPETRKYISKSMPLSHTTVLLDREERKKDSVPDTEERQQIEKQPSDWQLAAYTSENVALFPELKEKSTEIPIRRHNTIYQSSIRNDPHLLSSNTQRRVAPSREEISTESVYDGLLKKGYAFALALAVILFGLFVPLEEKFSHYVYYFTSAGEMVTNQATVAASKTTALYYLETTAKLVNYTVDTTVFEYLYASLYD